MKYNETITKQILEYLKDGLTAKDACFAVGISEETFYTWKKEKPEFSESIERELMDFKITCLRTLRDANDWKASAWWLERKYPDEFSLKRVLDVKYEPAQNDELTPEQKEKFDEYFQITERASECEKCEYASSLQK
ncbi:MAG: helix-turn-helix domain-containing protein [Candidatus Berkelbacteria bacterium]|nr:helix-turn-helix domain-containing protein [Candidatus Berkelbacteria bacterium]